MTQGTFSRLALLGLAAVASTAFAATTISGTIRLDAKYPTTDIMDTYGSTPTAVDETTVEPDDKAYFDATRARLNVAGDIAQDFTYFVRLEAAQGFTGAAGAVSVAQAYATWNGMDSMKLNIGKTPGPFFSADEYYYKPYIVNNEDAETAIGVIRERNGNNAGIDLNGSVSMLSYSVGMWKASDVSAYKAVASGATTPPEGLVYYSASDSSASAGNRLRFGYGARIALSPMDSDSSHVGVGIGFASTPISKVTGMKGTGTTYYTSFDQQTDFTVDACGVFGSLQVNAGYFHQRIRNDLAAGTAVTTAAASTYVNNLFNDDAARVGYYGEVGYMIIGDGYKYDSEKATVSGVKLHEGQGGLELVIRGGVDRKEDAIAWMAYVADYGTDAGVTSYAVGSTAGGARVYDNTDATYGKHSSNHFRTETKSFNVNLNYYVNTNTVLKAQYQTNSYHVDNFAGSFVDGSFYNAAATTAKLNKDTMNVLSLRAEYSF